MKKVSISAISKTTTMRGNEMQPSFEIGLIMRIGHVPIVISSFHDRRIVRATLLAAQQAAPPHPSIEQRQQIAALGEVLDGIQT